MDVLTIRFNALIEVHTHTHIQFNESLSHVNWPKKRRQNKMKWNGGRQSKVEAKNSSGRQERVKRVH